MTEETSASRAPRQPRFRRGIIIVFIIYMAALLYVTLLAWNYGSSYGAQGPGSRNYNLHPFESIMNIALYSDNVIDPLIILAGNIIMFMPFGFLLGLILYSRAKVIWLVPLLAMLLSISIELAQFMFTYRVSNIDDVILNTTGGVLGTWMALFVRRLTGKYNKK
ncbi:VanZ family protein [Sinobaca sp. H24]|uniref:VanZ family protein n=1 Tax=Sinobaca sp. H24 TaxID=2923376 RepID=UPI00207993B4|nr:VanZ family protein [Sinobaca sp. H24]